MVESCSLSIMHGQPSAPPAGSVVRLAVCGTAQVAHSDTLEPVTLIGSRRDCHLSLHAPDVSKVHCAIVNTGRAFVVRDLCSRTGTLLNGRPIREAQLKSGDRLKIGSRELSVEVLGGAPEITASKAVPIQLGAHTFDLALGTIIIGRRGTSDLVLDTPDVSYVHALLFALDGRPTLYDLGSRSGTFVNDARCSLARLQNGDRVCIGGERLVVSWKAPVDAAPPQSAARPASVPGSPPAAVPLTFSASPSVVVNGFDDRCVASSVAGTELVQALMADLVRERDALARRAAELDHRAAELAAEAHCNEARSQELDRRTADLQRWAAELEAMKRGAEQRAAELDQEAARLEAESQRVDRRAAEVERLAAEAQDRLAWALAHEEAVAAVLADLDNWHAMRESALQRLRDAAPCPPAVSGLPAPAPVLRPFAASPNPSTGRRTPSA